MAKSILAIFLLAIHSCVTPYHSARSPDNTKSTILYPFQVISADSAYSISAGRYLDRLDYIRVSDSIVVKHGELLLAHHSGRFFEFKPDSIVDIGAADLTLNYPGNGNLRPNLTHLFEGFKHEIDVLHRHGLKFSFPQTHSTKVSSNQDICLRWWNQSEGLSINQYKLSILDIYGDTLDTWMVADNKFIVNFETYKKKQPDASLFIVSVREIGINAQSAVEIGFRMDKRNNSLLDACNITSAVKALEIAYYLEFQTDIMGALSMYQLAADLSENSLYDSLLINYRKRYLP